MYDALGEDDFDPEEAKQTLRSCNYDVNQALGIIYDRIDAAKPAAGKAEVEQQFDMELEGEFFKSKHESCGG